MARQIAASLVLILAATGILVTFSPLMPATSATTAAHYIYLGDYSLDRSVGSFAKFAAYKGAFARQVSVRIPFAHTKPRLQH